MYIYSTTKGAIILRESETMAFLAISHGFYFIVMMTPKFYGNTFKLTNISVIYYRRCKWFIQIPTYKLDFSTPNITIYDLWYFQTYLHPQQRNAINQGGPLTSQCQNYEQFGHKYWSREFEFD